MKVDRSRVIRKAHQIYPIRSRARSDLSKPPLTVVALALKVDSVGKHRGVVAAKPFCVRNGTDGWLGGADSECRPSSAISRGERAGGPFPAPRTADRKPSSELVHHHHDPTSTANRLVSGDLPHF